MSRNTVLAEQAKLLDTFGRRGIGLTFRKSLPASGGVIIRPCNAVVSFLMRFSIDVIFLDSQGRVCHTIAPMMPWRVSKIVRGAKQVIELPTGTIEGSQTEIGDQFEIAPGEDQSAVSS